jgi:hypothetical protein
MQKDKLVMAAVAGISLGVSLPGASAAEKKDEVSCWGVNSCGSSAKCSVGAEDLAAFKALLGDKEYAAKFGKSESHDCGAPAAKCGASAKILNWTTTTPAECKTKGGYVIDEKDGKKTAKKA